MKANFIKKYPNATLSKFDFEVTFAKDGTVDSRDIFYKVEDLTSYDITSDTFRTNPEWTKYMYWVGGWRSVQQDAIFRPNKDFKMDVHTFRVYVTETENFLTKLEPIKPSYDNPPRNLYQHYTF
jgi:pyocin large subunit-like protein